MQDECCDSCEHLYASETDRLCRHPANLKTSPTYYNAPIGMKLLGICYAPYYQAWTKRLPRVTGIIYGGTNFHRLAIAYNYVEKHK